MMRWTLSLLFFAGAVQGGETFTFTVTADSHLDERTDRTLYRETLLAAAAARPTFHIDLGDTFMTEKHASRDSAAAQYVEQRRFFDLLGAPVHLVSSNHDGESGSDLDGTTNSLARWSRTMRLRLFPNPLADDTRNYYAWQHGDALFVVLDPYWYTRKQRGKNENWDRTLGLEQYRWLARTLESSSAKFKFIFIHQLVGGLEKPGRGGAEAAPFYEWGGKNRDGSDGFTQHRPGWPLPIHPLLVRNRVSVVFHGHDHLYAKQALDGIVYQEVPQPGDPRGNLRQAAEYGYTGGDILSSSGYLRVTVSAGQATVTYLHADQTVAHSYSLFAQSRQ